MPEVIALIDSQTQQRLTAIVADLNADAPAKSDGSDIPFIVTKPAVEIVVTKPAAITRPTGTHEVDIDLESEAMIEAACYDCLTHILVNPKVPEGINPEAPRLFMCTACAKAEIKEAIAHQRNVEAIHRTSVVKHQPRTTDGISHPVITTKEEKRMKVDIDNLSDAELGAHVRATMKATQAGKIEAELPAVMAERAEAEQVVDAGIVAEQERRKGHTLPAFMVGTIEVPELDLSDVSNLDESPNSVQRSPYNKVRFHLKAGAPLDPKTTTYRILADEHRRLAHHNESTTACRCLACGNATPCPCGNLAAVKVEAIVADLNPAENAKVTKAKALAGITGISFKTALTLV